MAKSKWPLVKDRFTEIEKWARDGLTEEQIAKNLGISRNTLNDYKNKYHDFSDALKRGKNICITEIENALVKRALGFEYEEIKTYIKDDHMGTTTYTEKTKKYQPPDVGACAILLKNKAPESYTNDKAALELKRQEMELRKMIEQAKLW